MDSMELGAPDGVSARLLWDPATSPHDRRRMLARELVAARLHVDPDDVRIEREAPAQFGYHTRLFASVGGEDVPLAITTTSVRGATVVAVSDPSTVVGIDLRDPRPDQDTWREIHRHSHLWPGTAETDYLAHWRAVQAILAADARGERVRTDSVVLDAGLARGWVVDRPARYQVADVSRGGFLVTLAYGPRVD